MAYTTINKPSDYFNTKLYTGNGTTDTAITGVGFQPDLSIIKARDMAYDHNVMDAVRGSTKRVATDLTDAESTQAEMIKSFASDGFNLGDNGGVNQNTKTYVAWNWKANSAGSSNTDGSITSTVSANTTSGFSIVSYTGNGTNNATFGHGLGVAPKIMIGKCTGNTYGWQVTGNAGSLVENKYLILNGTTAIATSVNVTFDANATTIKLQGGQGTNVSGQPHIAYCFAEKQGFSKFGSYTGNGNADGTFVYLGFKPAFVIIKRTDGTSDWVIQDNKRDGFNYNNHRLFANTNATEESTVRMDLLSNGFKCRDNDGNGNGFSYIYMAFAEAPLVGSNGVTAKAR